MLLGGFGAVLRSLLAGLGHNSLPDAVPEPESSTDLKLPRGASGSERRAGSAIYVTPRGRLSLSK